jgi:hypothetical protein
MKSSGSERSSILRLEHESLYPKQTTASMTAMHLTRFHDFAHRKPVQPCPKDSRSDSEAEENL